jgi:hypothetical protein
MINFRAQQPLSCIAVVLPEGVGLGGRQFFPLNIIKYNQTSKPPGIGCIKSSLAWMVDK